MKNKVFWLYSYRRYKKRAKEQNIFFDLSLEDFVQLSSSNCYYCNAKPSEKFDLYTQRIKESMVHNYQISEEIFETYIGKSNGIDRVDNDKGYVKVNCQPCCWQCNKLKAARTKIDFLEHIKRIYNHSVKDRHGKILQT